jgi:HSP90 family molecular chaperone
MFTLHARRGGFRRPAAQRLTRTVQSMVMPKLKKALTNQVLKDLEALAKNNAEKYQTFWQEFGVYLKQGIAANPADAETINPLLRFKTNLNTEAWSSLDEYVTQMKDGQKEIYYIIGDDRSQFAQSTFGLFWRTRHGSAPAHRPDGFVHADGLAQV